MENEAFRLGLLAFLALESSLPRGLGLFLLVVSGVSRCAESSWGQGWYRGGEAGVTADRVLTWSIFRKRRLRYRDEDSSTFTFILALLYDNTYS